MSRNQRSWVLLDRGSLVGVAKADNRVGARFMFQGADLKNDRYTIEEMEHGTARMKLDMALEAENKGLRGEVERIRKVGLNCLNQWRGYHENDHDHDHHADELRDIQRCTKALADRK